MHFLGTGGAPRPAKALARAAVVTEILNCKCPIISGKLT